MGAAVLEARTTLGADLDRAAAILAGLGQGAVRMDRDRQRAGVPITGGTKVLIAAGNLFEDAGIELEDLGIRRPSLDDVFLSLTGDAAARGPAQDLVATALAAEPQETPCHRLPSRPASRPRRPG